jgi:hypothetical protein
MLARHVLPRRQPHGQRVRLRRLRQRPRPTAALDGSHRRRARDVGLRHDVDGPDQQVVRVRRLPRAQHERAAPRADGLRERRAAQHDQPAAALDEPADRRPRLDRERAPVRQHQHVRPVAAQRVRERLRAAVRGGTRPRERLVEHARRDRGSIDRREPGRAEHGNAPAGAHLRGRLGRLDDDAEAQRGENTLPSEALAHAADDSTRPRGAVGRAGRAFRSFDGRARGR